MRETWSLSHSARKPCSEFCSAASTVEELTEIFERGATNRKTSSTKMNAESSRSHLVLSLLLEVTNKTTGAVNRGKFSLIDLAGSERAAKTGATQQQLKEANSINKSLSALGDVIAALSHGSNRNMFIILKVLEIYKFQEFYGSFDVARL